MHAITWAILGLQTTVGAGLGRLQQLDEKYPAAYTLYAISSLVEWVMCLYSLYLGR